MLLRAVNVGRRRLAMAELRDVANELGWGDPRTLLTSGNLLVTTSDDPATISARLRAGLVERVGFEVDSVVVPQADVARIAAQAPLTGEGVHLAFTDAVVDADALAAVRAATRGGERAEVRDGVLFVDFADGVAESRLAQALPRIVAPRVVTMRTWRTAVKLGEHA